MKKTLLTLVLAFLCLSSFAQLLPDGSVQIVAYWDKGDVFKYQSVERQEKTDTKGETSLIKSNSETFVLSVVEQTDSTYTLVADYKDGFYSDTRFAGYSDLLSGFEFTPLRVVTNQLGTVIGFENTDVIINETKEIIPKLVDETFKQFDKKDLEQLDREATIQYFTSILATPEIVLSDFNEDGGLLLQYHGVKFDTSQVYTVSVPFTLKGQNPVPMDVDIWVDSAETDSTYAYIHSHGHLGMDKLGSTLSSYIGEIASSMYKDVSEETVKETAKFDEGSVDQYSLVVVHLPSGCPVQLETMLIIEITSNGETEQSRKTKSIKLIVDETQ